MGFENLGTGYFNIFLININLSAIFIIYKNILNPMNTSLYLKKTILKTISFIIINILISEKLPTSLNFELFTQNSLKK